MGKKKLCLAIPSLQAGGMERVMSELAAYFSLKSDIELHLVLYGITREIFYPVPENCIIYLTPFKFNNRWRLFYTLKTLFYLRNTIKKINPISILSFGEYWNNFVLLSVLGLKYQVFVSDRGQPDKSLGWFHNILRKLLYPRAKGLILQTEKARKIYLSKYRHKNIAVIGNPIKQIDSVIVPETREKIVLMVGRLIKTKHQDKLIEMFARVNLSDWKLVIVGYDHLKQNNLTSLKQLSTELGIENRVEFTGKQGNIEELYTNSSVFAFPSSSEGFPNVIGEAMTAGLAVIAFDCISGPSEMITDGFDGFLIPLFDYEMFELKLAQVMSDQELRIRLGNNARVSILKYESNKICEAFYSFITS